MKKSLSTISPSLREQAEQMLCTATSGNSSMTNQSAVEIIRQLLEQQTLLEQENISLKNAETEFYKERDYYNDIFNNQPAGLYRIRVLALSKWGNKSWDSSENPPYTMELASDRFCEIIGITRQEFANNPFIIGDLIYSEDKSSFIKKNEESNRKLIPFHWEGRLIVRKKIIWIRLDSLPRPLENGDVIWTGILYNTTEQKKAEEALNETRIQLEDVLEGANIGTLEWNVQTGKIKFNDIWAKNLGYSKFEIKLGLTIFGRDGWKKITHAEDIPYADAMLQRHFSGELPFHVVEVRMRHKKGHWIWVRQAGKVKTWTKDGKPLLMYGTHVDISAQKQAEKDLFELNNQLEERIVQRTSELTQLNTSLRETEMKFRTVSDFTYDWEYWKSPDNKILFMSPSVFRVTGYTVKEFEKNPDLIDTIIHPSDFKIWNSHKQERCVHDPNEKKLELNFRIITKQGEVRWLGHVCRCINVDGNHLGVRVSNRDITDKINAENKLLGITVEVEERERNRFSSELHDGMGPLLSTIKLYFQWLADTDDNTKRALITEKGNHSIEMAIQTARELARGLSSQYVSESGYIIAINDFIERINDTKKIYISFKTDTYDRFDSFFELTLFRITTELIKNTLTYAQATNISISFSYDRTQNTISFNYEDNGIGFECSKMLKEKKGLGLMNIQQRVQIMKGNIKITSEPNEGMKTFIQFPIEELVNQSPLHKTH